ncbi:secondary thiamine-phosphate synthase enzyme YjbQ [Candidatus Pacearchaeota archaeon]|nr:secondary thiamine-phosphate synthase enzyme YjbQ [Candidatus Pacearchaeota archaeon]
MRCFFRISDLTTKELTEIHDLTDEITNYVLESKIKNGHLLIQPMHTTVGIYLNEGEPRLIKDFILEINKRIPIRRKYLHDDIDKRKDCPPDEPINCHSHLKAALFSNPSLSLIIFGGKLQMGKYQRILMSEFDGPCPRKHKSKRRYAISIIGD